MGEAILVRRGGGSEKMVFENYSTTPPLEHSTPTPLSVAKGDLAGASVGIYAIFTGGFGNSDVPVSSTNAYNNSLTRSIPTSLSVSRYSFAGASVGDYALFAVGLLNKVTPIS